MRRVGDDPAPDAPLTREYRCEAGLGRYVRRVTVCKDSRIRRDSIDAGRRLSTVSVASEVIRPQRVYEDQYELHVLLVGPGAS